MKRSRLLYFIVIGIAVFSLLVPLMPGLAQAHAAFVRSDPAPWANLDKPPQKMTIWFSQELAKDSQIKVFDRAGQRVDQDNTQVSLADPKSMIVGLKPLSTGQHRADWESVSLEDGDREKGSFSFTVEEAGSGMSTILIVGVIAAIVAIAIAVFVILRLRRRIG